ncbi:DUF2303 family protein [Glaciecola sp. KUL10]|uniref:DUF2303 family protein n=1 Tax=Glaciecola sp. (strain KUL10) TaxID=2161813 RepID=UPI000D784EBA|nr:DUF2303 family protein [Glaciecola sp. KUL10]GBL02956.1 hypothetical protein KUL10_02290 [Glaciecola sp. KUL10]
MQKDALEFIAAQQTTDILNDELKQKAMHLAHQVVAVPDNFNIKSLESLSHYRAQFRGELNTNSLTSFVQYCKDNAGVNDYMDDANQICINPDKMSAQAIFDLYVGDMPGHCNHLATLALQRTGAYSNLLHFGGNRHDQTAFSDFLEDWQDYITTTNSAGEHLSIANAVAAARSITLEKAREISSEIGDFDNSASVMERSSAKNSDRLPAFIAFKCIPYNGLKEREFIMKVSINTGGVEPRFSVRIVGIDVVKEEITDEFKSLLEEQVKALPVSIYVGTFRF